MTTALGTRLGTMLGTQIGQDPTRGDKLLYALTGFSTASDYYVTATPGGEPGQLGFGIITLFLPQTNTGTTRCLLSRLSTATPGGWQQILRPTNTIGASFRAAAAFVDTPQITLTNSDMGRLHVGISYLSTTQARQWLDRIEAPGAAAQTTYVPYAGPTILGGATHTTSPASGTLIVEVATFTGTPTDAQLLAAFDVIRATGTIPTSLAGMTISHKWPDKALLKTLTAPATIPDVVTRATADALTKTGAPTVTTIDLTRDGRVTQGLLGFQSGYYASAPGAGLRGSATGFTIPIVLRLDSKPGTGSHCITETRDTSPSIAGIIVFWSGGSTGLEFTLAIGGVYTTAAYTIPDADVGLTQLIVLNATGSTISVWAKRAQQTGNIAYTGYVPPSTAAQVIGQRAGGLFPTTVLSLFGMADGNLTGGATGPEILAMFDEFERTGRVPSLPARATSVHTHDFHQDIAAAGGTAPATIADRTGTDTLTRTGTGIAVAQRAERVYSYETSPILYGVGSLSTANYYSAAGGFAGGAAGVAWWISALVRFEANSGIASAVRCIAGKRNAAATSGYNLYTSGTNSTLAFVASGATGVTSPSCVLGAADVGKLFLVDATLDAAGKAHLYVRRVEQGTGSTAGSYTPETTDPFYLGRRADGLAADNVTIYGFAAGYGAPSLADIQAHFDLVMARERMESIPGFAASNLYRITPTTGAAPAQILDLAGTDHLASTGSPALVAQYARAFAW